ncbi:hypothetical protein B0H17DRAFT_553906 [Mycena rosella]|uniref:Uncharacterized protein n=1 Tax=Mycena rosella TaxID=1033263 RepID=A0AAD7DHY7_MYCRO|nr:hypothetical protein B0H17DRAFT_553906 [Mycena rosella]
MSSVKDRSMINGTTARKRTSYTCNARPANVPLAPWDIDRLSRRGQTYEGWYGSARASLSASHPAGGLAMSCCSVVEGISGVPGRRGQIRRSSNCRSRPRCACTCRLRTGVRAATSFWAAVVSDSHSIRMQNRINDYATTRDIQKRTYIMDTVRCFSARPHHLRDGFGGWFPTQSFTSSAPPVRVSSRAVPGPLGACILVHVHPIALMARALRVLRLPELHNFWASLFSSRGLSCRCRVI